MATNNLPTGSEIPGAPTKKPGGHQFPYYQGSDGRWYVWRFRGEKQGGPVWIVQDIDPVNPGGGGGGGVTYQLKGDEIPEDAPASPNKPQTKPTPGPAVGPNARRYPADMRVDRDTDYVMFEFFDYQPPFKANDVPAAGVNAENDIAFNQTLGDYNSNRGQEYKKSTKLAPLLLYMPDDISDTFKAEWEGKAFGATTAGVIASAGAKNKLEQGLKTISDGLTRLPIAAASEAIQGLAKNVGGDAIGVDDVFGGISGVIRNPNTELLFQKMNLRTFNLKFKLVPYNAEDVASISTIVKTFKLAMLPNYQITDSKIFGYDAKGALQAGFITVPNLCQVTYMQGGSKHSYLPTYKKCAITDFKVNYTPDNNYATLQNSFPVAVEINISFLETKLVFAEDVDPNIVLDLSYNKDGEYIGTTAPTGQGAGAQRSDSRLKENIVKVGNSPSGLNIYEWNYKSEPNTRYRGVMAQEVLKTNPDAVHLFEDGYLGVHYGHLDVNMEKVN